jgi:tetratricopeptide (TPR) repeat protein
MRFCEKLLLVSCAAALGWGADATQSEPLFTANGELVRPENYREWVFLTSGLGMTYGTAQPGLNNPRFDNVFVRPAAYRAFMESGKWPDGTMFILEIRGSDSHESINKGGYYQNDLLAVEAAVKDEQRFPEKWAYFGFPGAPGPMAKTAKAFPKGQCFTCHAANAAVENTFVQFYPTLLEVAVKKGTVRSSYRVPTTPGKFYNAIVDQGWDKAHALLASEQNANPESALADPQRLNLLGYSLMQNGKKDEAVALLKHLAESHPQSANAWDSLADAYLAKGDRPAALVATEKALALASTDTSLDNEFRKRMIAGAQERIKKLK